MGLALLLPKADVVLPSLWEQVNGSAGAQLGGSGTGRDVRALDARRWASSGAPRTSCPRAGLVCVGKHLARVVACVAPRLVPALVAANGADPEGTALEVARRSGRPGR